MLVLTRRISERILIGDDIIVTIVRIGPGTVRVGIEAPENVNIRREEIAKQSITTEEFQTEDRGVSVIEKRKAKK